MSEGFQVDPAALRAHAGHLDTVAGSVQQARAAGRQVSVDKDAYGKILWMLPALVQEVADLALGVLEEAEGALTRVSGQVREVAAGYDGTDAARAGASEATGTAL